MKIVVDIDETICHYDGIKRHYENAMPYNDRITLMNRMFDEGHEIIYWTARGASRVINNKQLTDKEFIARKDILYKLTTKQFKKWGVKYTELLLGKPQYDVFIDDKALNGKNEWTYDDIINQSKHSEKLTL